MNVEIFVTDKAGLQKFYEAIIARNETWAPVEKFGKFDFKRVSSLGECDPDSPIATTRSAKPLFFPRSAKIMKYTADSTGTRVKETDEDPFTAKRVILGMKHCDARSLQVLDKVYNWDYIDNDYQKRRQNTVVISTRCDKAETHCFCTSLDYDVENLDAMDVLIVNGTEGKVHITARTEKGDAFLKENLDPASCILHPVSDEELKKQYQAFAASFRLKMNYKEINEKLSKIFDSPEFEDVSANCISCNTCAFVCPTCHCFKISDERVKDTGVRYKSYDSCNNGYFTLMAGGHNPRPVKYRRWRQRALHKFVYYKERFGENLCVGCGKCAVSCPVNISIFEVVNQVASNEVV
ncbi:MAG: 4Fe-4S dicluster domain-containing protein [Bacteroidales bacterium]|jgi:ferredoxin|nr:4Fe-4S dicluster domain-containing protein [Bacteroidales bacterium]